MLSLDPRYNLFRFIIPNEFIPNEINEKWTKILNTKNKYPLRTPINIINESIQGISIAGIDDSVIMQNQTGKNHDNSRIEPSSEVAYRSTASVFDTIKPTLTITFKHIQGFYNYLLLYESWFYHHMKRNEEIMPDLYLEFLNDDGECIMYMTLLNPVFGGLQGLELSYNRVERSNDTFTLEFKGSAIDFEFGQTKTQE